MMSNQKRAAISQYIPPHVRQARKAHIPTQLRASVTIPQTMNNADDAVSLAVQPITSLLDTDNEFDRDEAEELAERRAAVAGPKSNPVDQTAQASGSTQHEVDRLSRLEQIFGSLQLELSTLKSTADVQVPQIGASSLQQLWGGLDSEPLVAIEDITQWNNAVSVATPDIPTRLADLNRPIGFDDLPGFEWRSHWSSVKSEVPGETNDAKEDVKSEILSYCTEPFPAYKDLTPTILANPIDKTELNWQPHAIAALPPFRGKTSIHPAVLQNKFSKDFLIALLAGPNLATEHSPGVYVAPLAAVSTLPRKTFYLISQATEPFLPKVPGDHGAKLTMFFNDEVVESADQEGNVVELPDYEDVPLFVDAGKDEYVYFGQYTQNRLSDALDFDTMQRVPSHVKNYWAEELSRADRPDWVTEALMKALFPKPEYAGSLMVSTATGSEAEGDIATSEKEARRGMEQYFQELQDWLDEYRIKTAMLKPENILQAFERSTADQPAGLRLQWEYLECVGFDTRLFSVLNIMRTRPKYFDPLQ